MNTMDERQLEQLRQALGTPPESEVTRSRRRVGAWFDRAAPLIRWDVTSSPLGPLYVAVSARGLCNLDFGVSEAEFLAQLDPQGRTARDPAALAPIVRQLQAYFAGQTVRFDIPLDLTRLTPFQRGVLEAALRIPPGTVWTYGQVAQQIGKPQASRAVGQALGRNPIPIVIPCHRVVGSDGSLRGYGAGEGLESKRRLLRLEGVIG